MIFISPLNLKMHQYGVVHLLIQCLEISYPHHTHPYVTSFGHSLCQNYTSIIIWKPPSADYVTCERPHIRDTSIETIIF